MKRAIVCYNCGKLKKLSDSYAVKVENYHFKGFMMSPKDNPQNVNPKVEVAQNKVRICRACIKRAGYKVKSSTIKKHVK